MFCFIYNISFSQETEVVKEAPISTTKRVLPRVNMRAAVTIPKVMSSEAFGVSFSGIFDANISVNVKIFSNVNVGAGYNGSLFINQLYFRQQGRNTCLEVHDGFVRLGYDFMSNERRFWSFSLNSGVSFNKYTNVQTKYDSLLSRPRSFVAPYLKPELALNFLVEENFAFGIHVAYNYCLFTYDPKYPAFDNYSDPKSPIGTITLNNTSFRNKANIGWISFGFGFYYGFKRKK